MVLPADPPSVKAILKRGMLVAAATWQTVLVQFAAESVFKTTLAVPLVGGAVLVVLLVGPDFRTEATADWRTLGVDIVHALAQRPAALAWFLVALLVTVLGGSAFLFLVKGGTVTLLVEADARIGPIERLALSRLVHWQSAASGIERYLEGCRRLFTRYLRLGYALLLLYAASGLVYLAGLYGWYRAARRTGELWPLGPIAWSVGLVVWITLVNFLYLLVQMVLAVEDCTLREALDGVRRFLGATGRRVAAVFVVVVALVVLASGLFFLLSVALGLVGFVPLVGVVAFPLQVGAWLVRGIVFQWLGLSALAMYTQLYRKFRDTAPSGRCS
jgi:hypothetical protein